MRARTLITLSVLAFAVPAVSGQVQAAASSSLPVSAKFIGLPVDPYAPYGTHQTALKPGDPFTLEIDGGSSDLSVSADLSALGVSSSTFGTAQGPYYGVLAGRIVLQLYAYNSNILHVGSVTDGKKVIYFTVADPQGRVGTATTSVAVDSVLPKISLASITFSATPPEEGDYAYLSGSIDGTGSKDRVYELIETAHEPGSQTDATGCNGKIALNYLPLGDALASSTDGSFTKVPITLFECGHVGYLSRHADSVTFMLGVSDEAGNLATTSITVRIPKRSAASNVLFIPGTEASRLYYRDVLGFEHQVWEPTYHIDIPYLAMNPDGTSKYPLYTKDIIRSLYGNNPLLSAIVQRVLGSDAEVYSGLEQYLNGLVASTTLGMTEWRAYPYDWRHEVSDIIRDGTRTEEPDGSIKRVYLEDVVKEMASTSPSGKITIIAHSNGGLLAKALVNAMGPDASTYIDKIIMVGTPQWGTPAAIGAALHADNFSSVPNMVINSADIRAVGDEIGDTYDLLPSQAYFAHVADPVVTFDASSSLSSEFATAFGKALTSLSSFANFLEDSAGLDAQTGGLNDTRSIVPLSPALMGKAETTHAALDSWMSPPGIDVVAIAGWGQDTVKTIAYTTEQQVLCNSNSAVSSPSLCGPITYLEHTPVTTQDGDGTVVSSSALGDTPRPFYFNTSQYSADGNEIYVHRDLMTSFPIQEEITDILTNKNEPVSYISSDKPQSTNPIALRISSHSPVNILVTDTNGNETGVVQIPETDFSGIKQDIPGSSVQVFDSEEYVTVPQEGNYKVIATGYASGPATLKLEIIQGDGIASTTAVFSDIPTTASSTSSFSIASGTPTALTVDMNGNGQSVSTVPALSPNADPLSYVRYMEAVVQTLALPDGDRRIIKAMLLSMERQLAASRNGGGENAYERSGTWHVPFPNQQKPLIGLELQVLTRYVEQQFSLRTRLGAHERNTQLGISVTDAEIILDMINELKSLLA
ncbi:MAG TPA: hypothetical protein VMV50_03745 [Candidatus Paceibacterota bacterium]|nr:hypothetical protein [Candidatus Paceibacterota bacterium]